MVKTGMVKMGMVATTAALATKPSRLRPPPAFCPRAGGSAFDKYCEIAQARLSQMQDDNAARHPCRVG